MSDGSQVDGPAAPLANDADGDNAQDVIPQDVTDKNVTAQEYPGLNAAERAEIKHKLVRGAGVRSGGYFYSRGLQVVRVMLFARIFTPAELGLFALVTGAVAFLAVMANFGYRQNIVRRRVVTPALINTAYTLSWLFGLGLFLLTLLAAPLISWLFSANLTAYTRFLAITVLAIPLQFPQILWEKELDFVRPTIAQAINITVTLLVTVFVQWRWAQDVWSLLVGVVAGLVATSIYIWLRAPLRPRLQLDRDEARSIMGFGSPFMVQALNGQVMSRGDNLMVGGLAGPTQLAFYNFAWQLPSMISDFTSRFESMLLPVYGRLADDRAGTIRLFNLSNKVWSVIGAFGGFFIILNAELIVRLFYGPQWDPVVPILRVMAISFTMRYCSGYAYDNIVYVRGRTPYMMRWGLVNTALVFTVGLFLIWRFGAMGGAWFWVLQAVVLIPLIRLPLIRQELGTVEFLGHIWQPVVSGGVAATVGWLGRSAMTGDSWPTMLVAPLLFVLTYATMTFLLDRRFLADLRRLQEMRS